jgi:hypothetical protein
VKGFIDQLKRALKANLDPWLEEDVYIDEERLLPGYNYDERLADAMCRSICVILVYSPKYERHSYCLREYAAMRLIENNRRKLLVDGNAHAGIIIPILFRGDLNDLPPEIKAHVHWSDFSKFTLATTDMVKHPDFDTEIQKIVRVIYENYKMFQDIDVCTHCDAFKIPSENEVLPWQRTSRICAPFPGRMANK